VAVEAKECCLNAQLHFPDCYYRFQGLLRSLISHNPSPIKTGGLLDQVQTMRVVAQLNFVVIAMAQRHQHPSTHRRSQDAPSFTQTYF
jgi:hypothetical protein